MDIELSAIRSSKARSSGSAFEHQPTGCQKWFIEAVLNQCTKRSNFLMKLHISSINWKNGNWKNVWKRVFENETFFKGNRIIWHGSRIRIRIESIIRYARNVRYMIPESENRRFIHISDIHWHNRLTILLEIGKAIWPRLGTRICTWDFTKWQDMMELSGHFNSIMLLEEFFSKGIPVI